MARAAPAPTISPAMYRHFAVITLSVTGCIAMFADGEKRQVLTDQIAQQQRSLAAAAPARPGTRQVARGVQFRDARRPQAWAQTAEPDVETAYDNDVTEAPAGGAGDGASTAPAAPPPAMFAAAPRGMPTALLGQMAADGTRKPVPRKPTGDDVSRIDEASRVRSGSDEG